jgi:hypothetical protein
MATTARGQKTAFLRDLFRDNPKVNYKLANEAWKEAGNDGDLSSNTFYNAKTAFKKEPGADTPEITTPAPTPKPKAQPARRTRAKSTTKKTSAPKNGQPVVPEPPRSHETSPVSDRDRVFDEVEAGIDDLIFRLKVAGGAPEIEAKLRDVRRSLHPSVR